MRYPPKAYRKDFESVEVSFGTNCTMHRFGKQFVSRLCKNMYK